MDYKWCAAALAYVRAEPCLFPNVVEGPHDRFGIIASSKAYNDTRQACADLPGSTTKPAGAHRHPRDTRSMSSGRSRRRSPLREFARGLEEILVVEEKRPVIEYQAEGRALRLAPPTRAPEDVLGKFDESRGRRDRRRMEPGQSGAALAAARAGRSHAIDHRQGDPPGDWPSSASTATSRRAHGDAHRADRRRRSRSLQTTTVGAAAAASIDRAPWFAAAAPHNYVLDEGARRLAPSPASAATTWRYGWTARRSPSARWAAKACRGSARRPSPPTSTSSPTSATGPTTTRASWPCARASRPR